MRALQDVAWESGCVLGFQLTDPSPHTPAQPENPPDPPGTFPWASQTAGEALAVSFASPTAAKLTNWTNLTRRNPKAAMSFCHNGLTSSFAVHRNVANTITGSGSYLGNRHATHVLSAPMLVKAAPGQTQTGIGMTLDAGANGDHNAHWQAYGALLHANNRDIRFDDGLAQIAMRIGWEMNIANIYFPWSIGAVGSPINSPTMGPTFKAYMEEIISSMDLTCDISAIEFVHNLLTIGGAPRSNIESSIADGITCLSVDLYDQGNNNAYGNNPSNKPAFQHSVFLARTGNSNPSLDTVRGAYWFAKLAYDTGRYFCIDEWGNVTDTVDDNGGDDMPGYQTDFYNLIADIVATYNNMGWAAYFNFDVNATGLFHKIDGANFPNAKNVFLSPSTWRDPAWSV